MREVVGLRDAWLHVYRKVKATRPDWNKEELADEVPPEQIRRILKQVCMERYEWTAEHFESAVRGIPLAEEWRQFCRNHLQDVMMVQLAKRVFEVPEKVLRAPLSPRKPRCLYGRFSFSKNFTKYLAK